MNENLNSRQRQALETKQKIKSAAIKLFEQKGFDNVYIEDIAALAGCSVGSIYHYFKNKEELSMHMTEHVDSEYKKLAAAYDEDKTSSARDKLLDFVSRSLHISSEETVLYASLIYGIKYPETGMLKVTWEREYFRLLRQLVTECQSEGSIPDSYDPAEIVDRLVTIHRGVLVNWQLCQQSFDLESMGRDIVRDMLKGMET